MPTRLKLRTKLRFAFLLIPTLTLFGCGGSDSNSDTSPDTGNEDPSYQVSVDVSGLVGTLTLQLTAGSVTDDVSASADGRANFSAAVVPAQTNYSVVITAQPTGQHCSLSENSNGTLATETQITITATCEVLPTAAKFSLSYGLKQFKFSWDAVAGATHYQLYENADGHSGFTVIASDLTTTAYDLDVVLYNKINARYLVSACNDNGECVDSNTVAVSNNLVEAIGYFKASNADRNDLFGGSVAISGDGHTLVIGADYEWGDLNSSEDSPNDSGYYTGAAYVFSYEAGQWKQQAYLKATNASDLDRFGNSVDISDDGDTVVIGAPFESGDSLSTATNSNENAQSSGAVYIFRRTSSIWHQEAYLKAFNAQIGDSFGEAVALSADGTTLAVSAPLEDGDSSSSMENPNVNASQSGAVYVFHRADNGWSTTGYLKASNARMYTEFGSSVDISDDGLVIAVGSHRENGSALSTSQNPNEDASSAGAAYVFGNVSGTWLQQQYIKASDAHSLDEFGSALAISGNGRRLVVSSPKRYINSDIVGRIYVFALNNNLWHQEVTFDGRVDALAMSVDGETLVAGNSLDPSNSTGINGTEYDAGLLAGAVKVYKFTNETWDLSAYIKASNGGNSKFGTSVSLANDGTIVVGAPEEGNSGTGVSVGVTNTDTWGASASGAAYIY